MPDFVPRPLATHDPHVLGASAAAEDFGRPAAELAEDEGFLFDLAVERCPFAGGTDDATDWISDFTAAFCVAAGVPEPSWA